MKFKQLKYFTVDLLKDKFKTIEKKLISMEKEVKNMDEMFDDLEQKYKEDNSCRNKISELKNYLKKIQSDLIQSSKEATMFLEKTEKKMLEIEKIKAQQLLLFQNLQQTNNQPMNSSSLAPSQLQQQQILDDQKNGGNIPQIQQTINNNVFAHPLQQTPIQQTPSRNTFYEQPQNSTLLQQYNQNDNKVFANYNTGTFHKINCYYCMILEYEMDVSEALDEEFEPCKKCCKEYE